MNFPLPFFGMYGGADVVGAALGDALADSFAPGFALGWGAADAEPAPGFQATSAATPRSARDAERDAAEDQADDPVAPRARERPVELVLEPFGRQRAGVVAGRPDRMPVPGRLPRARRPDGGPGGGSGRVTGRGTGVGSRTRTAARPDVRGPGPADARTGSRADAEVAPRRPRTGSADGGGSEIVDVA
ncbi:hypothetical protein BJF79_37145 [Actinomadura sp. CNU-125]|uniref:hypothetical protein n=1 Tax=Actinomadura sp. CNU-125 TaxID=1904961 RepID=UPI00095EB8F1|nr:hypothetical protein [Actinomadura sp. CNU-125]OLT31451.1 hypothetical protein BJF79_37145 [Actinomadura sp. CNU-125]